MTKSQPVLEPRVEKEIVKLCCSNTRDVKYNDIKWIMERLGFKEEAGGKHMRFRKKGVDAYLTVANHKPFNPRYLKSMCDFLEDNNLWIPPDNCK